MDKKIENINFIFTFASCLKYFNLSLFQRFLPEKKRKKKKKRKRNSNLSQQSVPSGDDIDSTSAETSARQVLPELRAHPILIHDGSAHHQNLHVHFQEAEEDSVIGCNTKPSVYNQELETSAGFPINEESHE